MRIDWNKPRINLFVLIFLSGTCFCWRYHTLASAEIGDSWDRLRDYFVNCYDVELRYWITISILNQFSLAACFLEKSEKSKKWKNYARNSYISQVYPFRNFVEFCEKCETEEKVSMAERGNKQRRIPESWLRFRKGMFLIFRKSFTFEIAMPRWLNSIRNLDCLLFRKVVYWCFDEAHRQIF